VTILKIDVEGMESCVIEGAASLFYRYSVKYIMIEVWRNLAPCLSAEKMLAWFERLGYTLYPEHEIYRVQTHQPPSVAWREYLNSPGHGEFKDWMLVRG
jgi:hypothetical protein